MRFNELSEKAKEKAIENSRYDFSDHFDGRDNIDSLNFTLEEKYGVNIKTINAYDLYNKELDIDFSIESNFLELNRTSFTREEYLILKTYFFLTDYNAKWCNHRLYGKNKLDDVRCVYCNCVFSDCECKEKGFIFTDKNLEDVTDEAGASLESIFADISVIIFDELSDDFEYMSSDEYVAECLEINDYDFDEDGNLL